MPSELYVQVPAKYGDFTYAAPDSPLHRLLRYGPAATSLLQLHLRIVLYLREQQVFDGIIPDGAAYYLALPAPLRTAKRDVRRLAEAGFIEPREGDCYFVPAAVNWPVVRVGTRDPIPGYIRKRIFERDGWRCVACGSPDGLTLDHIIPWSQNGPDTEGNLQALCGPCNSSKGARVLWLAVSAACSRPSGTTRTSAHSPPPRA